MDARVGWVGWGEAAAGDVLLFRRNRFRVGRAEHYTEVIGVHASQRWFIYCGDRPRLHGVLREYETPRKPVCSFTLRHAVGGAGQSVFGEINLFFFFFFPAFVHLTFTTLGPRQLITPMLIYFLRSTISTRNGSERTSDGVMCLFDRFGALWLYTSISIPIKWIRE